ncbi:uncharacterized protein SPPG_00857 [Spizellomyces punctatus DAOM BR117]|uniref:Signal recognition particle subunit SRP68 n=1 Tax=Spizellomyces punctatus (strain DAOM BR117) TaxID=645134 RepID=A0A0L0HVT2_SPIPD|nr:uncharacterized protein SPPG_00857 [Spizellomyces punctatus DAOM BR117]KND05197.1 hypothetical protein SPPG_00857 [Spizellomyces punctatus DAOM BR117]|eukprot:XP_016613236.1 hypothetical protein SPPG_00857 [Spizellomyces punctatus DAOM BR117]
MDPMDTDAPTGALPLQPGELYLNVLALTNEARNMHGLRHQDYQRYRQFCANKVQRLRKGCNLVQAGAKRRFEKKPVTAEVVTGEKHLQLLLFEAERGWAYAMELKAEVRDEPRKRFHQVKRLKKAVEAAKRLHDICQNCQADNRTLLDVQAYAATMAGFLFFEQQRWEEALDKFATARVIYQRLAKAGTAQQEALCQSVIDSIDPSIRFCAYNLKIKGAQNLEISSLIEQTNESSRSELRSLEARVGSMLSDISSENNDGTFKIRWRGRIIPTRNEKLVEAISETVKTFEGLKGSTPRPILLDGTSDTAVLDAHFERFEKALASAAIALHLAKEDVKNDELATAKVKSSKGDQNSANLQLALAYVTFLRLSISIDRNLELIEVAKSKRHGQGRFLAKGMKKGAKPEDIVRFYDAIIQGLDDMKKFGVVDSDLALHSFLSAQSHMYKAQRATFIAQTYSSLDKHGEALALYERANEHVVHARAQAEGAARHDTGAGEDLLQLRDKILRTETDIRGGKIKEQGKWYLEQHQRGVSVDGISKGIQNIELNDGYGEIQAPVTSRLNTFISDFDGSNPNLIAIPPSFLPAPCKPLFFDIAYNGLDFPVSNIERRSTGLERRRRGESEEEEKAKGIMGVLSGLWGRK